MQTVFGTEFIRISVCKSIVRVLGEDSNTFRSRQMSLDGFGRTMEIHWGGHQIGMYRHFHTVCKIEGDPKETISSVIFSCVKSY